MNKLNYWLVVMLLLTMFEGVAQTFTPLLRNGVFRPVSEVSFEAKLTVSGNYLYFVGRDGNTGTELWRTDGTPEGTRLVKDVTPGPSSSSSAPTSLFDANGTLYFFAGTGLYKTDGSEAGTVLLRNFSDIGGSNLLYYNGLLIFKVLGGIWRTDGTPEGTFQLASRGNVLKLYNGLLYFYTASAPSFQETDLLRTDGTLGGTSLIRQLPGTLQSWGVGVDGLYLTFLTGTFHPTPGQWSTWKSDGTAAGTLQLGPTATTFQPGYFNAFGDLYQRQNFTGPQPTFRQNRSTGVFEQVTPTPSSDVLAGSNSVLYNGQIYGPSTTPTTGTELSRLDGTPVRDLNPGPANGATFTALAVTNGLLYFSGADSATGLELWQTDGTAAGTRLVGDLTPGTNGSIPLNLTTFRGEVFFDTRDGTLWKLNTDQMPPVTPPTGTLTMLSPDYDCNGGGLTLRISGGTGSPIEYRVAGLRDWSARADFIIPAWQRTGTTFTIEVRQNGQILSQQFTTTCSTTPPPPTVPPVTPPTNPGGTLSLGTLAYNCTTGQLTLQVSGGNGSTIEYRIPGLRDWSTIASFTVPTWQRTGTTFTFEVRQNGQGLSQQYTTTCDVTPPTTPTSPVIPPANPGSGLSIDAPQYDCGTGQLTVLTTAGNGSPIEYRIVGLRDWGMGNSFTIPVWQRTGTTFDLEVRQGGQIVSRSYTSGCSNARLANAELDATLDAALYPNPVGEQFRVTVKGAGGKTIRFAVMNLSGGTLVEQSHLSVSNQHIEIVTMPSGSSAGLYLLRVSTEQQMKTLKVVKQ